MGKEHDIPDRQEDSSSEHEGHERPTSTPSPEQLTQQGRPQSTEPESERLPLIEHFTEAIASGALLEEWAKLPEYKRDRVRQLLSTLRDAMTTLDSDYHTGIADKAWLKTYEENVEKAKVAGIDPPVETYILPIDSSEKLRELFDIHRDNEFEGIESDSDLIDTRLDQTAKRIRASGGLNPRLY